MALPKVGEPAPDFTGVTDDNTELQLSGLQGHIVILYFYPRAYTPGCTREACSFRDNMIRLVGMGVKVVGVSTDSLKRQAGFKAKHELDFPLIADVDKRIVELFGVKQSLLGIAKRVTFLIDRQGIIRFVWPKVRVKGHVDEIITKIEELKL